MVSRGRKSAAEKSIFATMVTLERSDRPDPVEGLSPQEIKVWNRVVNSMPSDWFRPETHDLLASYCRHVAGLVFIDKIIKAIENAPEGDLLEWRKMTNVRRQEDKIITILATKMRLAQQSSYAAETAHVLKKNQVPVRVTRESREPVPPADPWS